MSEAVRVAFLLERFPVVSETFLLTEMRGLQDAGHDVDVVSHHRPRPGEPVHAEVGRSGLLDRTHYAEAVLPPDSVERNHLFIDMSRQMEVDGAWSLHASRERNQMIRPWVKGYTKHPILHAEWMYMDLDLAGGGRS